MVVLSAAICSNTGKPLLSRQFREMSKDSITAYLTNFSSLLLENNSQHTTIEAGMIRYIYQPVESFILVIITNLNSNIIQDIDTLQVFSKTVSSLLRSSSVGSVIDTHEVFLNSFEILNAFDEIITQGYKENLTPSQVTTFLEMNSHEEKLQEIIDKNKELEAAEERKRKAKEIHRRELERRANEASFASVGGGAPGGGMGSNSFKQPTYNTPTYADEEDDPTTAYAKAAAGGGRYMGGGSSSLGRGLQLGKKKPGNTSDFSPLLSGARTGKQLAAAQQQLQEEPEQHVSLGSTSKIGKPTVPEVENNGILIVVNEKISAEILRDGSIKSSEIKGDLQLCINNPELAHSKLMLGPVTTKAGLQFKTHPNVDKAKFNSNIITLKDQKKSFPSNGQALGVLRWRGIGKDEDVQYLPITFSIWTSENNGSVNVTVEYELQEKLIDEQVILKDLEIVIPDVGYSASLKSDDDNVVFNMVDDDTLQFIIKEISYEDPSGAIEFTVETSEEDYLFPMYVSFALQSNKVNFGGIEVQDVLSVDEEEKSLPYDFVSNVISENFTIV
ncbi:coatomer subunit delta [Saccharomycopsis crataegensis]|uniref:Coatomer subunit delta n=1 Tax=Saccharomycopsis crataegensis TaxID=43959 RepID=A0AAV5QV87_9ASCO|nr:coatomer subunit delta [Saccharomycopsis crataegensis]